MSTPEIDLHTSTNSYTIKEAAAVVGRPELTIRRRIDKGRFPGAELQRGSSGDEWRIPAVDLAKVAQDDGWEINLDAEDDQTEDQSSSDLLAAVEAKIRAESQIDLLNKDVQSLTDQAATVEKSVIKLAATLSTQRLNSASSSKNSQNRTQLPPSPKPESMNSDNEPNKQKASAQRSLRSEIRWT